MKTKFINEPPTKGGRRTLRRAGYKALMNRKTDIEHEPDLTNYGVEVSYIAPGTFLHQVEGYLRYLLATGGPREELRFYHSQGSTKAYKILFVYSDYISSVQFDVTKEDWAAVLFRYFRDTGILEEHKQKAL